MSLLLVGKSSKAVNWSVASATQAGSESPQVASVDFRSNGSLIASGNPPALWYAAQVVSIGNDFEIYAELITGMGVTGDFDAWLSLSTNREWTLEATGPGLVEAVIEVSIRKAGQSDVMHSGTITLLAEVVV